MAKNKKPVDKRLKDIMKFLEQFAQGNLDIKLQYSSKRDEMDGIMAGLNMMVEEIKSSYIKEEYAQQQLRLLKDILLSYSKQDFNAQLKITDDNRIFDEFAKGINDLGSRLGNHKIKNENLVHDLANRNNELVQFNYIVSHNLRAPIANILNLVNIISMPDIDIEVRLKTIEYIQSSAVRMDQLVKDLSVILTTTSALNSKKEKVSIPFLIENISNTLEKEILESGTIIKTNFSDNAKELFSIKSYMESILYNLIRNAIKFKSPLRTSQIFISSKKVNNNIIISFSDNGIGIDLTKHGTNIFGLYKRFHSEIEGKGMGLHMVKVQVEAIRGKIDVESKPNEGTTFTVTLPIQ